MILYFFYKNMAFTITMVVFQALNGYSGQTLYEDWSLSSFNLFFTSFPLVIKASIEQDINFVFVNLLRKIKIKM